ncbi:MAG: DUF2189 domain-containing protein, partial [Alphaproteobacteria bacterium]
MTDVWIEGAKGVTMPQESIVIQVPGASAAGQDTICIARIDPEAPWRWLAAGWSDFQRLPFISLTYGAIFTIAAGLLLFGLIYMNMEAFILALAGGFLLIGPVLAVGRDEGSRRLATAVPVSNREIYCAICRSSGQLSLLGLALMLIYLAWVEIALFMFMFFFGAQPIPPLSEFLTQLVLTWQGTALLVAGSIVGGILAALVFAISAISAPMLAQRRVGVATAVAASVQAVRFNFQPMALWAVLIVAIMALGIATFFVGLVVAFPLIGYATWHAYRDTTGDK